MTRIVTVAATMLVSSLGVAHAGVPFFNATCPTGIEVHADEGGPIYINGKEATLKTFNAKAYEAKHGHVTISLTINADGSPAVSYTKDGGANGICTVADSSIHESGHKGSGNKGCPPDVSEADRYKYPACK